MKRRSAEEFILRETDFELGREFKVLEEGFAEVGKGGLSLVADAGGGGGLMIQDGGLVAVE